MTEMPKILRFAVLLAIALALVVLPLVGCTTSTVDQTSKSVEKDPQYQPVWTAPEEKTKETTSPDFTRELYDEAVAYEPLLSKPGTQVSMGYWSSKGNHGSLVRVVDSINDTPATGGAPPQKAIWDEGATTAFQYPSYLLMLEEHWYERATPVDGKVTIYGKQYTDLHPVTLDQADLIWGQYSQRYADMAKLFRKATGRPVKAWCFVQGAKANRVFYKYELPQLRTMEQSGDVQVFFAKSQDADPNKPDDWIEGAGNAPAPVPAQ
ncbi:MAG: hypothetical protein ACYC99_07785 [Candidatus Geothermincolia bacterium]